MPMSSQELGRVVFVSLINHDCWRLYIFQGMNVSLVQIELESYWLMYLVDKGPLFG